MMNDQTASQRIVSQLEALTAHVDSLPGEHFATAFQLRPELELEVEGVGPIGLPLTVRTAHALCGVSSPAQHGYRDETRFDPKVRDTWEIPASRLRLSERTRSGFMKRVMTRVQKDLAIPRGMSLRAELHDLLVYERGQFFALHQDSEKIDGMVGTLVLTLPSYFEGGEFVLRHGRKRLTAKGSMDKVEAVAFYADCHHEVLPVLEGYRVVLTFNLVMEGESIRPAGTDAPMSDARIEELARAVKDLWQTRPAPRWSHDDRDPPDRLVFLLDHQYTEAGLDWSRLKGADAIRVSALKAVARQLDADIFLTLADVHQVWYAEEPYRSSERFRPDEDVDEDMVRVGNRRYLLRDLIEDDVVLQHWLAADGGRMDFAASHATDAEICMTTGHEELTPFSSEYEGYMGNYGNTLDRWYHRAAVVMWPRAKGFLLRARQDPRWAMQQILALYQTGDARQAAIQLQILEPQWRAAVLFAGSPGLPEDTMAVAVACEDAAAAAWLLDHFRLHDLSAACAPWVVALYQAHGVAWLQARLARWYQEGHPGLEERQGWMFEVLPRWLEACRDAQGEQAPEMSSLLLRTAWQDVWQEVQRSERGYGGRALIEALLPLAKPLAWLLHLSVEAGLEVDGRHFIDVLLEEIESLPIDLPGGVLAASLRLWMDREGLVVEPGVVSVPDREISGSRVSGRRTGKKSRALQDEFQAAAWLDEAGRLTDAHPGSDGALVHLERLHQTVSALLRARLEAPERAPDDWSIHLPRPLSGELGEKLMAFLSASTQTRLVWPLAKEKRMAVHRFIDRHELPVSHQTERTGSPYKLILEKKASLHVQEARQRLLWAHDLKLLNRFRAVFCGAGGTPGD